MRKMLFPMVAVVALVLACTDPSFGASDQGSLTISFNLSGARATVYDDFSLVASGKIFLKQVETVKYQSIMTLDLAAKTGSAALAGIEPGNYDIVLELYDSVGKVRYVATGTVTIIAGDNGTKQLLLEKNAGSLAVTGTWTDNITEVATATAELQQLGTTIYGTSLAIDLANKNVIGTIPGIYPGAYSLIVKILSPTRTLQFYGTSNVTVARGPNIDSVSLDLVSGNLGLSITGSTQAPAITAGPTSTTSGIVTWTTDESATSNVAFATLRGFDYLASTRRAPLGGDTSANSLSHSVTLQDLAIGQGYCYRALSSDAAGNTVVSDEASFLYTGRIAWTNTATLADGYGHFYAVGLDSTNAIYAAGQCGYTSSPVDFDLGSPVTLISGAGGMNPVIAKYGIDGSTVWARSMESGGNQSQLWDLDIAPDDSVVVAGNVIGSSPFSLGNSVTVAGAFSSNANAFLAKYDSNGNAQWAKSLVTAPDYSVFYSAAADSGGNIYAVGQFFGTGTFNFGSGVTVTGTSSHNPIIVKYDSAGVPQWAKTGTTATGAEFIFTSVDCDNSGHVYVAGWVTGDGQFTYGPGVSVSQTTAGSGGSPVLVKYSDLGQALWATTSVTPAGGNCYPTSVGVDSQGDVAYVANFYNSSVAQYDFGNGVTATPCLSSGSAVLLVKYSSAGVAQWAWTELSGSSSSPWPSAKLVFDANDGPFMRFGCTSPVNFGSGITSANYPDGFYGIANFDKDGTPRYLIEKDDTGYYMGCAVDKYGAIVVAGSNAVRDLGGGSLETIPRAPSVFKLQ